MKKKCVAMLCMVALILMTVGCGQKQLGKAVSTASDSTKNVVEEAVEEAIEEAVVVIDEELAAEEVVEEVSEDPGINEEAVEEQEEVPFITITDYVKECDKSEEYGVYSQSCYDIDELLNDKGEIAEAWDYESDEYSYYTGRFAYPEITPCSLFNQVTIDGRTDYMMSLYAVGEDRSKTYSIYIYSGLRYYNNELSYVGISMGLTGVSPTENMFTAETCDGQTDVLVTKHESVTTISWGEVVDDEGNVIYEENSDEPQEYHTVTYNYAFHVGNFSVSLMYTDNEGDGLTQEEIQEIIDSIRLTNGLER